MQVIEGDQSAEASNRGSVAAIGNFDGIHRGHLKVIESARRIAKRKDHLLSVVTFEPHPREYFDPGAPPFRLTDAASKARRLAMQDVDIMFRLTFDDELANLDAQVFAGDVIARRLGIRHAVVGADFRYGHGRCGDASTLSQFGQRFGFGTEIVEIGRDGGKEISSSAVRRALSGGDPIEAARILGHWHRIEGIVESGERRGRQLGYPTANLNLARLLPPRFGVYAVIVDILSGPHAGSFHGCASIGTRPTFGNRPANLEVYLIDFDGDIYDQWISVALVAWQRPEMAFDKISDLVSRMDADIHEARGKLRGWPVGGRKTKGTPE